MTIEKKTGAYWAAVHRVWSEVYAQHDRFAIRSEVAGKKLFEERFVFAKQMEDGAPFDAADVERHARETIRRFVETKLP